MKKLLISAAFVAGAALGMSGQANADCGEFQMSDMNWPSATLMANVDKIILEEVDYEDLRDEFKGKNLREFGASTKFNVKIVGYREAYGNYNFNPKADLHINENGVMIALGSPKDIERFKESVTHL